MKKYQLTMTKDYVTAWELQDAIRELLQNGIDHGNYDVEHIDEVLSITSYGVTLTAQSLLLGYSSKQDSDYAIGKFGEGFKLAMLVLTRNGYPVRVRTGYSDWEVSFEHSEDYCTEVLTVTEWRSNVFSENTVFTVENFGKEDYRDLTARFLPLSGVSDDDIIYTPYGEVLKSLPGDIYVNGLFVTNVHELRYGYNLPPENLNVGRDRNLVNAFDIKWETSRLWSTLDSDDLYAMLSTGAADVKYLTQTSTYVQDPYSLCTNAAKRLFDRLRRSLGNTFVLAPNNVVAAELTRLYGEGIRIKQVPTNVYTLVTNLSEYADMVANIERAGIVVPEALKDWYAEYSDQISDEAVRALFDILGGTN